MWLWWSTQWYHFGVGAPPHFSPFQWGLGCSLGGNRGFDPWPCVSKLTLLRDLRTSMPFPACGNAVGNRAPVRHDGFKQTAPTQRKFIESSIERIPCLFGHNVGPGFRVSSELQSGGTAWNVGMSQSMGEMAIRRLSSWFPLKPTCRRVPSKNRNPWAWAHVFFVARRD